MFPASTKGGGMCFAFPNVCKTPAAPSPLPIPYPSIGQLTNANGSTCSEKVKILNLRKPEGEMLDAAWIEKDWGVRPDQVIDFQALVGDSVDNIPGVPGV